MDERPIGVFDSGLGGLTMVRGLARLLPGEDIVYLGDTGRVPYGSRSRDTITRYADQDSGFLSSLGVKTIVIACNTVCSVAYDRLESTIEVPVFEVISAPVMRAAGVTQNKKIGIIGTAATIRSGAYESAVKKISDDLTAFSVACPLFVPLVEEGWPERERDITVTVAERYLSFLCEKDIDTLILGCTHYSLLSDVIADVMGSGVTLIDSGAVTAEYVAENLRDRGILSSKAQGGSITYYVTDSTESFAAGALTFLGAQLEGPVHRAVLE